MRLVQTIGLSYEAGNYILDGCVSNAGACLALSVSDHSLRFYDTHTASPLFDLRDHTHTITDLVSCPAQPTLVYSAQEDGGVMVTDTRQGRAVHFFTDHATGADTSRRDAVLCNTVALSPSGHNLGVALGGDVALVDTRTWTGLQTLGQLHGDDVTRARFLDEHVLCSAGEDQLILFTDTTPGTPDDDTLLQAINCGEVMTKMTCFDALGVTAMVGTCENGYVCPYDLDAAETRYPRPDYNTYLVDWCVLGGGPAATLRLVSGVRDEEGNAGPLSVYTPATGQVETLRRVHHEIGRVALGIGDRLITGAEDGTLAFWAEGDEGALPASGTNTTVATGGRSGAADNTGGDRHDTRPPVPQPAATKVRVSTTRRRQQRQGEPSARREHMPY